MEFISSTITSFNMYAKDYPIIAGGITLWGLGTLSWACRGLPQFFLESKEETKKTQLPSESDFKIGIDNKGNPYFNLADSKTAKAVKDQMTFFKGISTESK